MKNFAAIACVLSLCLVGNAADCRRVVIRPAAVVHRAAPLLLAHDDHDYGYGHRIGYNPANENNEAFLKLFEAYKQKAEQHEALLRSLVASGGSPPSLKAALAPPSPGLAVLVTNCAACHDKSVAKAKGGEFAWMDGGRFIDEGENLNLVMRALKTGKMGARDLPKLDVAKKLDAVFYLTTEMEPTAEPAPKRSGMPPAAPIE